MSFLKQLEKKEYEGKQKKKIEQELPYFIAFVTLLATSGFGPYSILKRVKEINLLPTIRLESERILKRIDVLGIDPLTAMKQAKDRASSKALGEFLNGYVSAVQGGGNVPDFLSNKLESVFQRYSEVQRNAITKVTALVESYMMIQIVILAVYIIVTAVGSSGDSGSQGGGLDTQSLMLLTPPLVSVAFIYLAHKMNSTKFQELKLKQVLTFSVPQIIATTAIILLGIFPGHNPTILVIGLIMASIWPAMKFRKIYRAGMHASTATPQILRDIAESRKAGIGPEKCVARACSRKNYNMFNEIANSIANKLEWGIPVKNIFSWMEKEIKDFQVLVSFKILFEIIAAGGGNVHTLGSLAGTSEKIYEIEKTKQDQVKPYLMIGFMLMGITGFTTLLVIDSLTSIGIQSEMKEMKIAELELQSKAKFEAFALSVIIQSWFAGLFLSKITTGTLSGGFQYSIILVIISLLGVIMIGSGVMDVNSFFGDSA